MIFNRIQWFYSLIKNRGLINAIKKLKKELYQKKQWVVFKLSAQTILSKSEKNISVHEMQKGDQEVFEKLSVYWPSEFPRYTKSALLQEFESRLSKGLLGYYLQENGHPIGAMWLSLNEANLDKKIFNLKDNDRIVKNIFISPNTQGRGLAKILVREGISQLKKKEVTNIYALVYPERFASINTFLSLGFENLGLIKSTTFLFKVKRTFTKK